MFNACVKFWFVLILRTVLLFVHVRTNERKVNRLAKHKFLKAPSFDYFSEEFLIIHCFERSLAFFRLFIIKAGINFLSKTRHLFDKFIHYLNVRYHSTLRM